MCITCHSEEHYLSNRGVAWASQSRSNSCRAEQKSFAITHSRMITRWSTRTAHSHNTYTRARSRGRERTRVILSRTARHNAPLVSFARSVPEQCGAKRSGTAAKYVRARGPLFALLWSRDDQAPPAWWTRAFRVSIWIRLRSSWRLTMMLTRTYPHLHTYR